MINEMLYFGTATPQGVVSPAQWDAFVDEEVTPLFPKGFTVWLGVGQWQSANGQILHEQSHVLTVMHADTAQNDRAIKTLVSTYKTKFRQEAVLRVRSMTCASL